MNKQRCKVCNKLYTDHVETTDRMYLANVQQDSSDKRLCPECRVSKFNREYKGCCGRF